MRRLNWGCGPDLPEGWVNSDRERYRSAGSPDRVQHHVGDIRDGLPYRTGKFDYVVSHHALQMIEWAQLVPTLAELGRVLGVHGWIRVSVPDLVGAMHAWEADDRDWFPIDDTHERSVDGKLCMYLTQAGATRSVFTAAHLADLLVRAGFCEPRRVPAYETTSPHAHIVDLDSRPSESIFMEAWR